MTSPVRIPICEDLTLGRDTPSGGAFPIFFMTHLDRSQSLKWSVTDHGTEAQANFVTNIEVTGRASNLPISAAYRAVCMYVLGQLQGPALREACEALSGIYEFEQDRVAVDRRPIIDQPPKRVMAKNVRRTERQPLTFTD